MGDVTWSRTRSSRNVLLERDREDIPNGSGELEWDESNVSDFPMDGIGREEIVWAKGFPNLVSTKKGPGKNATVPSALLGNQQGLDRAG